MKKILLSLVAVMLLSANSDLDSFDDFDSEFSDINTEVQKKDYKLTFNGSLKVRGYHFLKHTDYKHVNNSQTQSDSVLELNGKFKKDDYLFGTSLFALIGTEHNTYNYSKTIEEFRDTNQEVPIAGIRELYMLESAENYDFTIGKKIFKAGIATLYSPTDIYNISLSPDPLDPYTLGVWLSDFEYYSGNSSYGIVFFPVISNMKTFSPESRWSGNQDVKKSNINNFVVPTKSEIKQDTDNKIRVLLKYKTNTIIYDKGIDFIFDVGYGPSLYTILEYTEKKNVYLETRPKALYFSTGFSTTYKKFEIHSEVYYQKVIGEKDDNFISAVGGGTYTLDEWIDKLGLNKVSMTVDYVKEIITNKFDADTTYRSSDKERAPKNDILIKADAEINDKWTLSYFGNFRLEIDQRKDSGRYQKFSSTYKLKDGIVSDIFLEVFNGDENSYYGKWKQNDRIGVQIKYSF